MRSEKLELMQLLNMLTNILATWDTNSYNLARNRVKSWLGEKPVEPEPVKRIRKAGPVATVTKAQPKPEVSVPVEPEIHEPRVISANVKTGIGLGGK